MFMLFSEEGEKKLGTSSETIKFESARICICMEFAIDDYIYNETIGDITLGEISSMNDENKTAESLVELTFSQDQVKKMIQDFSEGDAIPSTIPVVSIASTDEPYVGQEFESEAEAHAFYNAYATRVGFILRISKLARSRRDGSAIGRALVCNKVSSSKWIVTKFVKEHTHPLTPGKGRKESIYKQYPHAKIRELSQQLAMEKKRSATYKRQLELIFEHIEEHNKSLSEKILSIVESVKDMEAQELKS